MVGVYSCERVSVHASGYVAVCEYVFYVLCVRVYMFWRFVGATPLCVNEGLLSIEL